MLPNLMRSGFADKVWEVRLTWGEPRQPATLALRARPGLQQGSVFHLSRRKSSQSGRWNRWRGEFHRNPSGHRGSCPRAPCQPWTARSPSLICKGSKISFPLSKTKWCWTITYIWPMRIFKFPLPPNGILYPTIILNICSTEESWLLNAHYNAFLEAVHVCKLKLPIVSRVVGDVFLCAALPPRRSTNQKREQVWADQSWCRLAVEDDCFFSMESLKENHGYVHWDPPLHYTSQSVKFLSSVHLSQEKSHDSNGLFTYYYGKD